MGDLLCHIRRLTLLCNAVAFLLLHHHQKKAVVQPPPSPGAAGLPVGPAGGWGTSARDTASRELSHFTCEVQQSDKFVGIPFWRGISSPPEQSSTLQLVIARYLQEPHRNLEDPSRWCPFPSTARPCPSWDCTVAAGAGLLRTSPFGHLQKMH